MLADASPSCCRAGAVCLTLIVLSHHSLIALIADHPR
jgi:hypothetical protein